MTSKHIIHPAQRRLIEALARRDVARYLRAEAARHQADHGRRQNHVELPARHRAA